MTFPEKSLKMNTKICNQERYFKKCIHKNTLKMN